MADSSSPYTKSHSSLSRQLNSPFRPKKPIEQQEGKSYFSGFFHKSLIFALFLIVFALFPSQAPDFITQTIFTKLWELLHLLFIGIAVAYGLFSSRNNVDSESDLETRSIVDNTPIYVSKMFPVSWIFGDGCEIPCGSDEKRRRRMMMMYCWSSKDSEGELGFVDEQCKPQLPNSEVNLGDSGEDDGTNVVQSWNSEYHQKMMKKMNCWNSEGDLGFLDGLYKSQLPNSEENLGDSVKDDGTNVVQSWNSKYHKTKPVVVVAQPYYTIGESEEIVAYKPLGLPVRSLRSSAKDLESSKYTDESDSSSGSRVSSSERSDKSIDRKFGDLGPSNLEQKFNDAAGLASPITRHSRSRRTQKYDKHGNANRPSHFRPLSVDETSFLSQVSLYSSLDSISSENVRFLEEEEMEQMKTHSMSSSEIVSSPSPPPTRRNAEVPLQESHSIGYSMNSSLQADMRKNQKDDDTKASGNRELKLHSLLSNTENPASLAKAFPQGISVRTRRASEPSSEMMRTGEICSKRTDKETIEKMPYSVEEVVKKGNIGKQNLDPSSTMLESTASNCQKRDKEEEPSKKPSNEDLDFELENCSMSYDEEDEVVSECVNDSGLDSEVDKKASEFIAKFKAQIRLQKKASVERSRGLARDQYKL